MAIVETDDNSPLIFLYSSSEKTSMTKVGEIPSINVFKGWDSAIGEEEQELGFGGDIFIRGISSIPWRFY